MAINVNWNRWILASAFTHFTDLVGENLILDGSDRDGLDKDPLFAEFRLDGPRILQLAANYYRLWFAINIVVTSAIDPVDLTKKHDLIGDIVNAFTLEMAINKYGTGGDDDQSLLECATLSNDFPVRVNQLGQIDKTLRIEQATIEGHYLLYLTTS